jgi:hypothetical protein
MSELEEAFPSVWQQGLDLERRPFAHGRVATVDPDQSTLRSGVTCGEATARAGTAIVLSAESKAKAPTPGAVKTATRLTMKRITILR